MQETGHMTLAFASVVAAVITPSAGATVWLNMPLAKWMLSPAVVGTKTKLQLKAL